LIQLKQNSNYKNIGIKVRDLNGKLIYFEQPQKNDFYTIDLSKQAKGIYLLELVLDDKRINQKIILK